ncbi:MAG: YkgJ family cysteine cluster protein [Chitinophagaceae bacterium]|nr:YkgJ family cysteine cluster protein [Chitinophagaceae bacterium]
MSFTYQAFKRRVKSNKGRFRSFLTRLEKKMPRGIDSLISNIDKEVWKEVDCLACANCCKTMTPTYTEKDIKRIAAHLDMTADEFKKKWLKKERSTGDWLNKSTPCQFLNLKDNKCSIYEVRPVDCAGFPHLPKKRMKDYMHVHKQNVEYCPATYKMVEKLMEKMKGNSE